MQLTPFLLVGAIAVSSAFAQICSGNGGIGCTTSGGSWLYISAPVVGQSFSAGDEMSITWNVCGFDPAFKAGSVTFSLVNATNPNNAIDVGGALPGNAQVTSGSFKVTLPATLPAGAKYALKSTYRDVAISQWDYCFSNQFAVTNTNPEQQVPVASASSVAGVSPAVTSKPSGAKGIAAVGAIAALAGVLAL